MNKVKVTFFQRKRVAGHFSIEFIFEDIKERLSDKISIKTHISPFISSGFFKRLYNLAVAKFHQGQINHITGDIHYITLGLSPQKTILTIHDCGFLNSRKGLGKFVLKTFWLTLPVKFCTKITVVSQSTKNEVIKHSACHPDKIVVIPVAISKEFRWMPKEFFERKPRILQIGSALNKNQKRIIESLSGLSVHLVIVGNLSEEVKATLYKCEVEYSKYANLSLTDLINQYYLSDIVLFPSTYEGFGMPIIEAQTIGRVVITSNISSMPEVAGDGAHFVDPFDTHSIKEGVLKVMNEPEYRNQLIKKGKENAKRFAPDYIASQYLQLYEQVAKQNVRLKTT